MLLMHILPLADSSQQKQGSVCPCVFGDVCRLSKKRIPYVFHCILPPDNWL